MFESLSDRLTGALKDLRGKGRLSGADIDATCREIRLALLEADVALPVVRCFIARIKERAKGAEVSGALNPAQQVVKIVNEELVGILGGETRRLQFAKTPPTVIMLAGLQGSGKTTLAGKLAKWLKDQGHTPLLVACDLQRPGAVSQLQIVGERAGAAVFAPHPGTSIGGGDNALGVSAADPVEVAQAGVDEARNKQYDVVIVDTAGRLGIDAELMAQAAGIRDAVKPDETLFVLDSMIGQDAVSTAEAFRDGVGFTGVVLTKLDGDARGGAALSVREVTGAADPVRVDRREARRLRRLPPGPYGQPHPRHGRRAQPHRAGRAGLRCAAGRGRPPHKIGSGQLTLEDFLEQMMAVRKMGPIGNLLGMLPGAAADEGRARQRRREAARPGPGDHPRHDPGRAREPEDHQRFAPTADRERLGRQGLRRQPARRPLLRGPQDDGRDGRTHGHARCAQADEAARRARRARRAARARRSPRCAAVSRGMPGGMPGMGGMPAGMPDLSNMPKGLDQLPPGLEGIDLSQLKLPKK